MKHPQGAPAPEEEPVKVRLHGVPATVNHDGITEALASRDFISGPNGDYSSFEKLRKPEGGFDAVVLCNNREAAKRMVKAFECFRWPRANCLTHASLVEVDGSAEDDDISERTVFVSGLRSVFNNDRLKALMEKSFGPVVGCVVGRPQGEGPDGLLSGFCTFASQNTVALALCTSRAAGLGVEMALVKMKAFGDDPRIERYHSSMGIQLMSYYMASLASEKGEADKPKQKPRGLLPTPKKPSAGSRKADSSSGKKGRNRPSVGEGKQPSVISLEMALSNGVVNGIPFLLPAGAEEPPFLCLQKALNLPPLEAYNATQMMTSKILSLAELLPDNISTSVDNPFDRCVYVEGIRESLTSSRFCYIMAKAFGPVSEHRLFATVHGRAGVCIFATRHSAVVAAATFVLAKSGDLLARRFMDALGGPDVSIECYVPFSSSQPSFCPLGLLFSSPVEGTPRIICLEDELTVQPSTPLTGQTPTTTASGDDDATPRRSTLEEFKDAAKRALQLLLLEADDKKINLSTVEPSWPGGGLVNEDDLRRRFPLGGRVGDITEDNSSDEQCVQQ
ncbi:hypothetical protein FOL47_009455 [Perkinsus chesapeaki]|uniref:RRM domain-containing protein n=1 Tax=Perkinsus chesapeaki TaxID=330153 RepID=A0A7J6MRV7_PERCH|nr:hypothetical protein FOL47_009455 [Perkinsus chesapeaki]